MKRILVIPLALIALTLCACQNTGSPAASDLPAAVSETSRSDSPDAGMPAGAGNENATPGATPGRTEEPPAMLADSDSVGFRASSVDEFEMLMIDRADIQEQLGYSLSYHMPVNVPDGFSLKSILLGGSSAQYNICISYTGPGLIYETVSYVFRSMRREKDALIKNLNYYVEQGSMVLYEWNGQEYYIDKIDTVSPNDDGDTPGIKPQSIQIYWFDDMLNQAFYVVIPNLTEFDESLLRYCQYKTVVVDAARVEALRGSLLASYSDEFPVDFTRIEAEADFSAGDTGAFGELLLERTDVRETYGYSNSYYGPHYIPQGYALESITCGRAGIAFIYRKGESAYVYMAYNRYRNDLLNDLNGYRSQGRAEYYELEKQGGCYVTASEFDSGYDLYWYDDDRELAFCVHVPGDEFDEEMIEDYCCLWEFVAE